MKALIVLAAVLLMGCDGSAKIKQYPVLPDELSDCKFYELRDQSGTTVIVARCGFSTTVKKTGKNSKTVIVTEGDQ